MATGSDAGVGGQARGFLESVQPRTGDTATSLLAVGNHPPKRPSQRDPAEELLRRRRTRHFTNPSDPARLDRIGPRGYAVVTVTLIDRRSGAALPHAVEVRTGLPPSADSPLKLPGMFLAMWVSSATAGSRDEPSLGCGSRMARDRTEPSAPGWTRRGRKKEAREVGDTPAHHTFRMHRRRRHGRRSTTPASTPSAARAGTTKENSPGSGPRSPGGRAPAAPAFSNYRVIR